MTDELKAKISEIIYEHRGGTMSVTTMTDKIADVVDMEYEPKHDPDMCVICHKVPVDTADGQDTCTCCAGRI